MGFLYLPKRAGPASTSTIMRACPRHTYVRFVRKAATIFVAKIFQRIWPPLMIGAMFTLEVAWILFLVYAFVRLLLPGSR
jgi:hypothetical protein